ncbi:MAG: hypothetical protein JW881_11670 [Spirochaetales bacterium]|nr:hypothetical protein [Spirochaetales bacterium]
MGYIFRQNVCHSLVIRLDEARLKRSLFCGKGDTRSRKDDIRYSCRVLTDGGSSITAHKTGDKDEQTI